MINVHQQGFFGYGAIKTKCEDEYNNLKIQRKTII